MPTYRVLSLDGGGLRGLITTVLLQRLVAMPGLAGLLSRVDLVSGTSTGGLLALAIARGLDLARIRQLYVDKGRVIFDDSWLDDLVDLGRLRGAEYKTGPLRRELTALFGDTTLGQLGKRVLIPTFDLDNDDPNPARRTWKPKLFHNFPGSGSDRTTRVVDVGLYTTAAPTYFPSVDGYVDGGVYANNPAMCALAQTQDTRYQPTPALRDLRLFSLGTGTNLQYITGRNNDWGYAQWAKPLINLMMDGTAGIADYQCRQLLDTGYIRLAPTFPPGMNIPLDDVKGIPEMGAFAEAVPLDATAAWLRQPWMT